MPSPYAGTNGHRTRENDEGYGARSAPAPRTMVAKFKSRCVNTGAAIQPGDTITFTKGVGSVLVSRAGADRNTGDDHPGRIDPLDSGRYISNVFRTSGGTFFRNKRGRCEDAPCCGCCTI